MSAEGEDHFPSIPLSALRENLARIEDEIAGACRRANRARSDVALVAVSKGHPAQAILDAASLGLSLFGENRVQEFQEKLAALSSAGYFPERRLESTGTPQGSPSFHFIGHLQSNKSARAAELFSSVDTLDSLRVADRLHQAALLLSRRLAILIEIKLGQEPSKTGFDPESPELHRLLERLPDLRALDARGLMTIPPYQRDPSAARPYFARLRELRDHFASKYPRLDLRELSMGMSHDFSVAIEEGSTQLRIGTRLFGPRRPPQRERKDGDA